MPWTFKPTIQDWKAILKTLREGCPTRYPVRVERSRQLTDLFGDVTLSKVGNKPTFKIRICESLDFQVQVMTLVHEWAHCMTWNIPYVDHEDHSAHWGIAYSEAYRIVYQ